jgi:prevent-host-death family protein
MEASMKSAAVSKLKAMLSEYLARVKAGEEVVVTERGRPIAKIVPFAPDESAVPPRLLELARAGLVRLGSGKLPRNFWKMPRPADRRGAAVKALLEERAHGR